MKKILVSLVAFLSLTACPQPQQPLNDIEPTPTPDPYEWSANLTCSGQITRAQWLTCDNAELSDLHRRLAYQWQVGSQGASPQRLAVIEQQQRALVAERDACEDAVCVRNAYLRYLPPQAKPTPTRNPHVSPPPKKWVKPVKRPVKWRPGRPRDEGEWRDVDSGRACSADIGLPNAQELARQCDRVTQGQNRSCRPDRSCASLRRNIAKGCNETYRKPGFCARR